jgi:restriction system protein
MAVPDFQSFLLPLLVLVGERSSVTPAEAKEAIANSMRLSDDDRRLRLQSGLQYVFDNRLGWARTYLKKAGLLESPKRGVWAITDRGRSLLQTKPARIDVRLLRQFPEFEAFHTATATEQSAGGSPAIPSPESTNITPAESLASAFRRLRDVLMQDLSVALSQVSPEFFERVVVDVLVAMGYGGNREDAGQAIGRSGDGGIDGIIKEDKLGLETIYIQAKRWDGTVGRPEIQRFAGALQGHRARKGVFITTSAFSKDAREYVSHIDSKIVLIDGIELTRLMVEHNVGVSVVERFETKRLDSDYFAEE